MGYKSPLHFLEQFEIESMDLTKDGFLRLQKKILAEFELQNAVVIEIGNHEYTKDAVIKLLEYNFRQIEHWDAHQIIYQNKEILAFCEDPQKLDCPILQIFPLLHANPEKMELKRIVWDAVLERLQRNLKWNEYAESANILVLYNKLGINVLPPELLQLVYTNLHEMELFFGSLSKENFFTFRYLKKVTWMEDNNWVLFFNNLQMQGEELRDELAVMVLNFMVEFQKTDIPLMRNISLQFVNLDVRQDLAKIISDNHRIFMSSATPKTDSGIGNSPWQILWLLVLIGFWVVKCINSSSEKKPDFMEYKFNLPEPAYYRDWGKLDSLPMDSITRKRLKIKLDSLMRSRTGSAAKRS